MQPESGRLNLVPESEHNQKPRESNRKRWPEIAAFVDELRKLYGDGISVVKIIDK